MVGTAPLPPFAAIVVAAGKGLRVGGDTPKQFRKWRGRALIEHSVGTLIEAGADPCVIVIADGSEEYARIALKGLDGFRLVSGGATRQESVQAGLEALDAHPSDRVLIHDAARPDLPREVIVRLLSALDKPSRRYSRPARGRQPRCCQPRRNDDGNGAARNLAPGADPAGISLCRHPCRPPRVVR